MVLAGHTLIIFLVVKEGKKIKFHTPNMTKKTTSQLLDWLNYPPAEEEISKNLDGSEFIPIGIVENKLTRLDPFWGTENFRFQLIQGASGCMFADGSLELVVTYGGRTRRLVGAATLLVPADTEFDNPVVNSNFGATVKSECIKNSAKGCGRSFGSALNERDLILTPVNKSQKNGKQKPPAVKMKPDSKIQSQYNKAFENNEDGLIAALNDIYEIQYTGLMGNAKTIVNAES